MSKITTIGLDLAKNVFHVVGCDAHGKRVRRKQLRRGQMLRYFANLLPSLVGMASCASASYWARELQALGHAVKLIPPQYVKPYVRGNKNDYNDALAIAEAVVRPQMRYATRCGVCWASTALSCPGAWPACAGAYPSCWRMPVTD